MQYTERERERKLAQKDRRSRRTGIVRIFMADDRKTQFFFQKLQTTDFE